MSFNMMKRPTHVVPWVNKKKVIAKLSDAGAQKNQSVVVASDQPLDLVHNNKVAVAADTAGQVSTLSELVDLTDKS